MDADAEGAAGRKRPLSAASGEADGAAEEEPRRGSVRHGRVGGGDEGNRAVLRGRSDGEENA